MKMIEKIVKVNGEHILELWLKDQEWTTEMKMGARMYYHSNEAPEEIRKMKIIYKTY